VTYNVVVDGCLTLIAIWIAAGAPAPSTAKLDYTPSGAVKAAAALVAVVGLTAPVVVLVGRR
jgi:hypothetical protein